MLITAFVKFRPVTGNIDTNAFIEAYRREACLWNVFDEQYKNRVTKTDAQKWLAEEFVITGKVRTIL